MPVWNVVLFGLLPHRWLPVLNITCWPLAIISYNRQPSLHGAAMATLMEPVQQQYRETSQREIMVRLLCFLKRGGSSASQSLEVCTRSKRNENILQPCRFVWGFALDSCGSLRDGLGLMSSMWMPSSPALWPGRKELIRSQQNLNSFKASI